MPTYDYYCSKCNHEMEVMQKITEEPLKECPKCHAKELVRRPGGGIGLAFSGDGFYSTMYGQNKSTGSSDSSPKEPPASGGGCCPCGKGGGCTK